MKPTLINSKLLQSVELLSTVATLDNLLEHSLSQSSQEILTICNKGNLLTPPAPWAIGKHLLSSTLDEIRDNFAPNNYWELVVLGLSILKLTGKQTEFDKQISILAPHFI